VLFGDDAFGPEVVHRLLASGRLPDRAHAEDVGTSVRDVLFNIVTLPGRKVELVIVVDAVDVAGRTPGEVFEIDVSQMPKVKMADFSFHQFPTSNLLHEARELAGVDVRIVAAQARSIPDFVQEGMSPEILAAVDAAADLVVRFCSEHLDAGGTNAQEGQGTRRRR
jgi:coenzyme F420 hydrogenase subunit delta